MSERIYYQKPEELFWMYSMNFYQPTEHLSERYRKRMSKHIKNKTTKQKLLQATDLEIAKRANYMLLFSIHGRNGETPNTEVRYYFEWDIVIDNKNKTIITMYINKNRKVPPARLFGDRKLRKLIYDLWFKPNSKYRKVIQKNII